MAVRLHCPTCRREIEWSEAFPYRPFCSERCRLIDLGAWLGEQRAIPGEALADQAGEQGGGAGNDGVTGQEAGTGRER